MALTVVYPPKDVATPPAIDIVAVHGLGGDAFATWTHPKSKKFWLKDFLPGQIPDARIMTFGYNAVAAFGQSTAEIIDHAKSLLASLIDKREEPKEIHRPLIFIAHSLGGIVVKQSQYQAIKDATLGLIFLGTPHRGSDKAMYGKVLANVAQFMSHRPPKHLLRALETNSDDLLRLTTDFRFQLPDYEVYSFFELRPMKGLSSLIVEKHSALLETSREEQIPVDTDHRAMCKFETEDDDTFEKVYKRLRRMRNDSRRITNEQSVSHNKHFEVPHLLGPVHTGRDEDVQRLAASFAAKQSSQTPSAQITLAPGASTAMSSETDTDANVGYLPNSGFNPAGWTILHAAVNNKSIEGVTAILAMGRDPNSQTVQGWTPLWVAGGRGLLEISRLLLEAGANVNTTNREGTTALKEAAQIGATELVQLLVEHRADVNLAPHIMQDTPLIVASVKNHIEVVKILLAAGADSRAQQSGGWSALHYALLNKHKDMATLILGYDPDVNASTKAGLRPLHLAALAGFADICARILDLGAKTEVTDNGGLTALRVAVQAGQLETVKLLVERGSRTDVAAEDGHTLIEVALILGHVQVYQYLEEQGTR